MAFLLSQADPAVTFTPYNFYHPKSEIHPMAESITLKTDVELGVVPTHIKFVGGLVPDDNGRLPRGDDGKLIVVSEMEALTQASPVKIQSAQVTA